MVLSAHIATNPNPAPMLRVLGSVTAGEPTRAVVYEPLAPYDPPHDFDMITDRMFPMPDDSLLHEDVRPGDDVFVNLAELHNLNELDFIGSLVVMSDVCGNAYFGRLHPPFLRQAWKNIPTDGLKFFGVICSIRRVIR